MHLQGIIEIYPANSDIFNQRDVTLNRQVFVTDEYYIASAGSVNLLIRKYVFQIFAGFVL
jgi:hypothetical protein